jgi:hypothetical protein
MAENPKVKWQENWRNEYFKWGMSHLIMKF